MKKVRQYKYTRLTHFKDGRIPIETMVTKEVEPHISPKNFADQVSVWDRQGNSMKKSGTLTDIYGYDYWITEAQQAVNEHLYKRSPIEVY